MTTVGYSFTSNGQLGTSSNKLQELSAFFHIELAHDPQQVLEGSAFVRESMISFHTVH